MNHSKIKEFDINDYYDFEKIENNIPQLPRESLRVVFLHCW